MIITRQDPTLFKLQTGDVVLFFRANSHVAELKINNKKLVMDTAGEYEMDGVTIESAQKENWVFFAIHWDDMTIGLGGAISSAPYDILLLFVPPPLRGGVKALAPLEVGMATTSTSRRGSLLTGRADIDARVIIPFGEEKAVAAFLKELDETPEEMEKLTIKKKDLPEGARRFVALKPLKK